MLLLLDPDQDYPIALDCDAKEPPEKKTIFWVKIISPAVQARMQALVNARRQAFIETGGNPTDQDIAETTRQSECQFIASLVARIQLPGGTILSTAAEISDTLFRRIAYTNYEDLVDKMLSSQGITDVLGKGSASLS